SMAGEIQHRSRRTSRDASRAPRVGVPWRTAKEEGDHNLAKIRYYYDAIEAAGGEPVAVSLALSPGELKGAARSLDAIVLPGSPADVDPARYGAPRHPRSADADKLREDTDYALLDDAFAAGKPVLAICYGAQLLNVCLGGSLYHDIADEFHSPLRPSREGLPPGAADPVHPAKIESGGEIAQFAAACGLENSGGRFEARVNSSHHQAIRDPGRGLRVAAHAPDGVIEAVEHAPHKHWVIG